MNNNEIKKILSDLYALDPALRSHEKDLIAIIQTLAIKPEAHYDSAFAANLRVQLLAELERSHAEKRITSQAFVGIFMGRPFRYAVLAVAVIAVGAIAFISLHPKTGGPVALNSSKVAITNVGANAFGTLSAQNTASGGQQTQAQGSGVAPVATNAAAPMMAAGVGSTTSGNAISGIIARPINPVYFAAIKYDYTGSPISQTQTQLNVLKKVVAPLSANQATAALEQAGFGQVDISSFNGLTMSTVTLSENQNFGYQISLDLAGGTISIDQNYNEWPQNATTPLAASDIPSDGAVITTVEQFFAMHGIATTTYGAPKVSHQNNMIVPATIPKSAISGASGITSNMPMIPYYSDSEQVLYPLVVNGQNVYDTNGNEIGLTVEVNVRYNRVSDVYGLDTESYQSSAYDAITDAGTILSMAKNPLSYPVMYNTVNGSSDVPANTTTYDLGTPTMAYETVYQTDSQGQSNEFLVPAFVFPVLGNASDTVAQNIVVPLIKDFEQQAVANPPRAIPL